MTKDTFEYAEWPSRKPTKKKLQREALKRDPLGTGSQIISDAAKRATERSIDKTSQRVARNVSTAVVGSGAAAGVRASAAVIATAATAIGVVTAALYAMGKIAEMRNVALGERANRISREFVSTQQAVMRQYGARSWDAVPAEVRNKLVNGYKAQIAKLYSTNYAGSIRPSQAIPYGR